ncbi:hypothetical protein GCK72_001364 [Caenorhabditis remanei]|uniref:Uncharacterized protein n=1 Tax=Caenorhabditis remanei TaxID=31234 RepID=A0A6A5HT73_CAERE|nr:hypothetical protein GCK72_001364 [Caenorhabditis remanei]KAF1769547.1 hypothetical protein GCK72_001364 [Caenorhabditis remanei]
MCHILGTINTILSGSEEWTGCIWAVQWDCWIRQVDDGVLGSNWLNDVVPEMFSHVGMSEFREMETIWGEPIQVDISIWFQWWSDDSVEEGLDDESEVIC